MEDIPYDSKKVELWIHQQISSRHQTTYIADELLKLWDKNLLYFEAKQNVSRFCIVNGFFAPLIRMVRADLRSGAPLQWGILLEILELLKMKISTKVMDACLVGATRDKKLLDVSAMACLFEEKAPRWKKIYESEIGDKQALFKESRDRLSQDIQIFQQEGMHDELKESVSKILQLYPEDHEAQIIQSRLVEKELNQSIDAFKRKRQRSSSTIPKRLALDVAHWPDLGKKLDLIKKDLNLESTYFLSIGLFDMGLFDEAYGVLSTHQSNWGQREKFLELEIKLAQERFAEGLDLCQGLMKEFASRSDTLIDVLYYLAKCYYGLGDSEQSISILRALLEKKSDYRDADILLREWEHQDA